MIKVIFDTNIWIIFLIGKELANLEQFISRGKITVVLTEQLLVEIKTVTSRPKLIKYFPPSKVAELLNLLEEISENVQIPASKYAINRDPKDNFLLDLIYYSGADYLITGDKDLLLHDPFEGARIITPSLFEAILETI